MFIVIVGCGKVGVNTARSLLHLGHEVIVVEQRKSRYDLLLEELGDCLMLGDGTEIWVLEKAGIGRADLVVAVTGDDEDNIIISQIAKLKYAAPKVVARVNNPFNQPTFDLLGIDATICAATNMLRLIMHELPAHKYVPLLTLKRENIEVVELEVGETSPLANRRIADITLPERRSAVGHPAQRQGAAAGARRRDPARRLRHLPARARQRDRAHSRVPARGEPRRGAGRG